MTNAPGADRRSFIIGAAGIAGAAGVAAVAGASAAEAAPAGDVRPADPALRSPKVVASAPHSRYSLKYFRKHVGERWHAQGMTLLLEGTHPIRTLHGTSRHDEYAFGAVFKLVAGAHAGGGTFVFTAPDGNKFDLFVSRVSHGNDTRYQAIINRYVFAN